MLLPSHSTSWTRSAVARERAADLHAFLRNVLDLHLGSRHLLDRPAIDDRHVGALAVRDRGDIVRRMAQHDHFRAVAFTLMLDVPQPPRDRGDVHRRVAAADHQHLPGGRLQAPVVEGLQEGDTTDDVGRVAARHGQRRAALRADADEDGVELLLQLLHGHVDADLGVHAGLDAHVEDALDLPVEHIARRPVAGDAVAHHATQLLVRIEDRHGMPHAAQLVGRAETGRTAADAGHLLACIRARVAQLEAVLQRIVPGILLDCVDADMVLDLVAVATVFAGRRTHPAHDSRHRVGVGQAIEGVFLPVHPLRRLLDAARDVQPAADILAGRATALAGWCAMHISRTFVRLVGDEDFLLPWPVLVIAVLEPAIRQFRFVHALRFLILFGV